MHERFTTDMVSRVQLADQHIRVPKLIAFDTVNKVMVTEFLKGETVDEVLKRIALRNAIGNESEVIRQCGLELAKVHNAGYSLIDTQPVNCLWLEHKEKVYFTDLEYCTADDKRAWDVGFFLCFLTLRLEEDIRKQVREIFLKSYQNARELNLSSVAHTSKELSEYLPVLQTILDIREFTPEELVEELITN